MKKVSLTKLVGGLLASKETSVASMWRPTERSYPRLKDAGSITDVAGRVGLYAVWHLGVRPQWLRVGMMSDLAAAFATLARAPWIVTHEGNAGIYVAWAFPPQDQCAGMVRSLAETLKPAFQADIVPGEAALDPATVAVACELPPGTHR